MYQLIHICECEIFSIKGFPLTHLRRYFIKSFGGITCYNVKFDKQSIDWMDKLEIEFLHA